MSGQQHFLVRACVLAIAFLGLAPGALARPHEELAARFVAEFPSGSIPEGKTAVLALEGDEDDRMLGALEAELRPIPGMSLVSRSMLDQVITEHATTASMFFDASTGPEIGRLAGANSVVVGRVWPGGNILRSSTRARIQLIDASTGVILHTMDATVDNWNAFPLAGGGALLLLLLAVLVSRAASTAGHRSRVESIVTAGDHRQQALQQVRRSADNLRDAGPHLKTDEARQAQQGALQEVERLQRLIQESVAGMPRAMSADQQAALANADRALAEGAEDLGRRTRDALAEAQSGDGTRLVEKLKVCQQAARYGIDALAQRGIH